MAAALNAGDETSDEVFEILRDSLSNQHEIGGPGRHVYTAFLLSDRAECWELMEKTLLAAQRQDFVRGLVGVDRAAAQSAFAGLLGDRSLTPPQIRFVELVIDQLTARGVIDSAALYEPPFTGLHAGGPDGLFAGRDETITSIFHAIEATQPIVIKTSAS